MQSAIRYHLRSTAKGGRGLLSPSRRFGTSSPRQNKNYAATLQNLRIGSKTRVIFQGFTGRHATANAKESIEWGTNIVGGVVPGREAEHLGLPVLPSVRRAMEELRPDATGIYVPASMAAHAIEEAVEAEVPLIVAVAEHVPLHDMLRIHGMLKTQTKSRLVGPNSPGIINAAEDERCRIGFQPLPCFSPGCVGIAAKSGTLSYEAVASTTRAGLGQSLCIGVGGDVLPGTDLVEALQVLETDPNTKAIALIGEIGGDGEILAAQWIREYHDRTPVEQRKPIVALIAGRQAPMDRVMGHAGAFWLPGEPHPNQKTAALKNAGVTLVVNHPSKIGPALRKKLFDELEEGASFESTDDFARAATGRGLQQQPQRRGLHTSTRSSCLAPSRPRTVTSLVPLQQSRGLHLDRAASEKLLADEDKTTELQFNKYPIRYLALGIDRATRSQCLTTAVIRGERMWRSPMSFNKILLPPTASDGLLSLTQKETKSLISRLIEQLQIPETGNVSYRRALGQVLRNFGKVFKEKEAKHLGLQFAVNQKNHPAFSVQDLRIELDEAAYRSGGRLKDVHEAFGALEARDPGARQAERDGIVYHRLTPGDRTCNIGTLSNGAGLAMNTVDALADAGGKVANFLDTGGKATSKTVKRSLETILQDDRVGVIFVNIFGGLTRGDTIAQGVILAYNELQIKVPVVIRIRGTNEREGQRIIAKSGLPLYAYDDFDEAAAMAVMLAKGGRPPAPKAFPEVETETKVSELKDAIQSAAEDIMEHGGFEGDGTGTTIVAATELKDTISEATGPQDPNPAEASQPPDEEANKAAVNDASQKHAAESEAQRSQE
ncbi:hypothetical protein SLS53_002900 [Cytospora paraplurivora]|uniref:CoA-binding domain-containing protein n=1 Tax=Cytospora paraplurivora TaxID=2898453 RepID=A0AAN9UBV6_9PEZI